MLAGLFLLCYTFFIAWMAGCALMSIAQKVSGRTGEHLHSSVAAVAGLCFISLLLQVYHIFFRLDAWAHVFTWIVIFLLLSVSKTGFAKRWNELRSDLSENKLVLAAVVLAAVLNITGRSGTGDIGDYHLQAIRWAEEYPVVPGIGNLIRQLAHNSGWFLLHAFSGCWFVGLRSVYVLNALLLVLAVMYFFPRADDRLKWLKGTVLLYVVAMAYRKYTGAVTNDYAITVVTLLAATEWISVAWQREDSRTMHDLPVLFIIMILPTWKLSALYLLLLCGWSLYSLLLKKDKRIMAVAGALFIAGLAAYIPWLYTNVMQSGYLCYPVAQINLFDVDWKMPLEVLEFEHLQMIAERAYGMDPMFLETLSFSQWFPLWIMHLDPFSLGMTLLFAIGTILLAASFAQVRTRLFMLDTWKMNARMLVAYVVLLAGMALWLFSDPSIRFVFACLVLGIAIFVQLAANYIQARGARLHKIRPAAARLVIVLLLCLPGLLYFRAHIFPKEQGMNQLLLPAPYTDRSTMRVQSTPNGHFYVPEAGMQCWDSPLPCIARADSSKKWRGIAPVDGFRTIKPE